MREDMGCLPETHLVHSLNVSSCTDFYADYISRFVALFCLGFSRAGFSVRSLEGTL